MKLDLRDEVKVTLVTAVSIAILLILSNVLKIKIDFISYLVPMFVLIIYFVISRDKTKNKNFFKGPLFWSIVIILVSSIELFLYYIY